MREGESIPKITIIGIKLDVMNPEVLVRVQLVTRSWSYRWIGASIFSFDPSLYGLGGQAFSVDTLKEARQVKATNAKEDFCTKEES